MRISSWSLLKLELILLLIYSIMNARFEDIRNTLFDYNLKSLLFTPLPESRNQVPVLLVQSESINLPSSYVISACLEDID
jgi:hypothetical protein